MSSSKQAELSKTELEALKVHSYWDYCSIASDDPEAAKRVEEREAEKVGQSEILRIWRAAEPYKKYFIPPGNFPTVCNCEKHRLVPTYDGNQRTGQILTTYIFSPEKNSDTFNYEGTQQAATNFRGQSNIQYNVKESL